MFSPTIKRLLLLLSGPAAFLLIFLLGGIPDNPNAIRVAAVALWMGAWWMLEAVPLWVTALLPMILFPILGVDSGAAVASRYFHWVLFLFLGGFLFAAAMERWNLGRRLALTLMGAFGTKPSGLLFGTMAATFFLSMWISNTATTLAMVPLALGILSSTEKTLPPTVRGKFSAVILLGVAYAASLGGLTTLVGTPPNLTLVRNYTALFPNEPPLTFTRWLFFALPLGVLLLLVLWWYLKRLGRLHLAGKPLPSRWIRTERKKLGALSFEEKTVGGLCLFLVSAWITRKNLSLGFVTLPGWENLFPNPSYLNDGVTAVTLALFLFLIPSRSKKGSTLLDTDAIAHVPWGILLLFGGGLALATSLQESGLSTWIGEEIAALHNIPPSLFVLLLCLSTTFLSELASNTAIAEMLLPIAASTAKALGYSPFFLMAPAALACSLGFMLPVATPPNAIIFATGKVPLRLMLRAGLFLNLAGSLAATLWTLLFAH